MKRVIVKSLFDTFEYVMQHYYPVGLGEMVERSDTYAIISIQYTHTGGFGVTFTPSQYCQDVLTLYFDDVISDVDGAVLFTDEMAKQIIDFIKKNRKVETPLVHCYAGQSRPRAVSAFAVKMLCWAEIIQDISRRVIRTCMCMTCRRRCGCRNTKKSITESNSNSR